ncbi:type IV pilus biogenesis protein PilI [Pseudomonas sp. MDT1-17]
MTPATEKVEVTFRTNEGDDKTVLASDIAEALSVAKKMRTPESYMVCVVQDGVRTMRWDRATIVGENRWRQEDPGAFELLGAVRNVRVVHPAPSQDLLGDEIHPAGLRCYQVGESDWFAAASPEHALELMRELMGDEEEYEVELTGQLLLDERWGTEDEPGKDAGSLREWLAAAEEPGWLAGTEG